MADSREVDPYDEIGWSPTRKSGGSQKGNWVAPKNEISHLHFSPPFLSEKDGVKKVVFDPFFPPDFIGIAPVFSLARGAFPDPEPEGGSYSRVINFPGFVNAGDAADRFREGDGVFGIAGF